MDLSHPQERLVSEFAGPFSPETVAECLNESAVALMSGARIEMHVPVLAERFARERLRAAARS
jgi:arsenate reductase